MWKLSNFVPVSLYPPYVQCKLDKRTQIQIQTAMEAEVLLKTCTVYTKK